MTEIVNPPNRSELARAIGVDRTTLMRWEKEGRIPPPRRVSGRRSEYDLADAYEIQALAGVPF